MRAASSADKLMVSHKAGHELLLLLLLLPLTDKQTAPPPLLAPHIHYAAIAVVAARRGPATLCAVCVCGSFFGRLQQLPASKLSGKVCWLANNNGDMRLQCATNEGKQAARAARAAHTAREAPALLADTQHCLRLYTCTSHSYPLPLLVQGRRALLPAAEDGTSWHCYMLQLEITQPQMR